MSDAVTRPGVGVGIYIHRSDGKLLFTLRKGTHGEGSWSVPGGHLEFGETWEECGAREALEETGVTVKNIQFLGVTNDIFDSGKHYVTIALRAEWETGEPRIGEPEKCSNVGWFGIGEYPEPLFLSTRNFLKNGYNPLNFK